MKSTQDNTIKVALVTGGSSGIGLALARRFIEGGYQVVITGRDVEKLNLAVAQLGGHCHGRAFDMDDLKGMKTFVSDLQKAYGRIDVLVNNAGINHKEAFTEVTDAEFLRVMKTNTLGLFALSREVSRVMIGQPEGGSIVNITSMAAHYGIPKVIAYTASKSALEGMTRAMAVELSPLGIRVNAVAPGFIKTPMSSKALDSDADRKSRVLSRTPLGKLGRPEDVAEAVYFLASPQAAFITGETLRVDGGNAIGF